MDLYRLSSVEEFEMIGGWEYFLRGGVCVIEWADRLGSSLPRPYWKIELFWKTKGRSVTVEKEGF